MKTPKGFTLIEVMIVVAVFGVLTAIAAPFTADFIARSRLSSASRELYADLQGLRRDAMTTISAPNGRGYGIRFISDARYELFEFNDLNNNYRYDAGVGEEFGPEQQDLPANMAFSLGSGGSVPGTVLLFDKQGLSRSATWSPFGNAFVIRKAGETQGRCVVVALARIREGVWNGSGCDPF